ncbi:MAG: ATP-binding cassette domain-containing protein [Brockia lithotrophica]|nr:ATP-binding cassette domain-containing protein [Brockia lithotrophica]
MDDLSFDVRPGRIFGLLGANGAGKTTTLPMIFGIVSPDAGRITWCGRPLDRAIRRRIGYLPEEAEPR